MVGSPLKLRVKSNPCWLPLSCSLPSPLLQLELLQGRWWVFQGTSGRGEEGLNVYGSAGYGHHVYLVPWREGVLSAKVVQSAKDAGRSSGTSVGWKNNAPELSRGQESTGEETVPIPGRETKGKKHICIPYLPQLGNSLISWNYHDNLWRTYVKICGLCSHRAKYSW